MASGGKRRGAGRPKGAKGKATLEKEALRQALYARVAAELEPMIAAQIANATGIKYLVVREKTTGRFVRVAESMAKAKLRSDEEIIEVWEKDPCVQAFTDLMNRVLGKPAEEVKAQVDGTVTLRWAGESPG